MKRISRTLVALALGTCFAGATAVVKADTPVTTAGFQPGSSSVSVVPVRSYGRYYAYRPYSGGYFSYGYRPYAYGYGYPRYGYGYSYPYGYRSGYPYRTYRYGYGYGYGNRYPGYYGNYARPRYGYGYFR